MFKEIWSGIKKVFNRKELILVIIILIVGASLLSYSDAKAYNLDGMEDGVRAYPSDTTYSESAHLGSDSQQADTASVAGYNARQVNTADELLPSNDNSEWARLNPGLSSGGMPDLLSAGYHIGISTPPMRNANLQYRSDPVIPKRDVGPWNTTTIDQDISRAPLEIGSSA